MLFSEECLIALIDNLVPSGENPHNVQKIEELDTSKKPSDSKLLRTGLFTALAVGIHNFPEGLATFISALQEPSIAIPIAVAIAIHNIPEGIAVSVPVYYATGSRKKAFLYSFLSGLSEPIGALVGYLVLMPFINDPMFVIIRSSSRYMVFISLDELFLQPGNMENTTFPSIPCSWHMVMAASLLFL